MPPTRATADPPGRKVGPPHGNLKVARALKQAELGHGVLSPAAPILGDMEDFQMLLGLAALLVVLWALGFLVFHVAGGLIHLLIVIAIIVVIFNFVSGRRRL